MNDSSNSSPRNKRGGKGWVKKKKKDKVLDLPLSVQGIPHLSNSFIQKSTSQESSEKIEKDAKEVQIPSDDKAEEKCSQEVKEEEVANNQTETDKEIFSNNNPEEKVPNDESKTNKTEYDLNISVNVSENDTSVKLESIADLDSSIEAKVDGKSNLPNNENQIKCEKIESDEKSTCTSDSITKMEEESKDKLGMGNERGKENLNNCSVKGNKFHEIAVNKEKVVDSLSGSTLKPVNLNTLEASKKLGTEKLSESKENLSSNKNCESKVEFISVYSSDDTKKKVAEASKALKESEPTNTTIGPLQPIIPLVDPEQLEKETEKYYKEVGSIPNTTKTTTNKFLTPGQVASITKNYPQVNPSKGNTEDVENVKNLWSIMHQYWAFVQENPYNFDGWTCLLNHVATMDNIEAARSAFEGFLPLYPYCFAYWIKYSDLELKFSDLETSLGVLYLGTKCVPFCNELWVPLLNKFFDYAETENISEEVVRGVYEYALERIGLSWLSSSVWDVCINYEMNKGDLVRVMNIYRRLLNIPNKLYNKHWDHLLALVRDYHPRNLLTIEEYSNLKKSACNHLKIKFNPPSLEAPKTLLKVTQPEDKIHTTIKEKIVASLIPIHEANEAECDLRWKFEEKIKRPYFHVKPLDKKGLRTWREYVDFEIKEGDPVRIVTLFERCLVPCAMYEEFWCKYTSYMEDHVLNVMKKKYVNVDYTPGCFSERRRSVAVDDGDVKIIGVTPPMGSKRGDEKDDRSEQLNVIDLTEGETNSDLWVAGSKALEVNPQIKFDVAFLLNRLSRGVGVGGKVLNPPSLTPSSILRELTWEDVRQIYRRAAWIHCPSKPLILMQWAEFEEAQENVQTARELLNTVIVKHPKLLKARIQLIELERRNDEFDRVDQIYAETFSMFDEIRIKSCIAIRYARFLFKIREQDDKALLILRKALKKDKGNIHLYHHVFDVCYQRRPIDCNGVLAAVMLALASKELSLEDKYFFCVKRAQFLREHGTMAQVKEAKAEMEEIKLKLDKKKDLGQGFELDENKGDDKTQDSRSNNNDNSKLKPDDSGNNDKSNLQNGGIAGGEGTPGGKNVIIINDPDNQECRTSVPESDGRGVRGDSSRAEKSERRRRREREREREGESDGGRRHKRKSSKTSRREKKSSRKSGSRREDRRKAELEDGEMVDEPEMEDMFDSNGKPLYTPSKEKSNEVITNANFTQKQNVNVEENKPYQAVPPSWDLNASSMSSYGYGGANEAVKEGQNSLYERYYDLVKQGYNAKEPEPQKIHQVSQGSNVILGNNNSYLPPPPMPGGILGESLFNQGKFENLHSMDRRQGNFSITGNTNSQQPHMPPHTECPGTMFKSGTFPQPNVNTASNQLHEMPPSISTPNMGMMAQNNPVNNMMTNIPPNFSHQMHEPPGKVPRLEPPNQSNMAPNQNLPPGNFPSPDMMNSRPGGNYVPNQNNRPRGNFPPSDRSTRSKGSFGGSDRSGSRGRGNYSKYQQGSNRIMRPGRGRDKKDRGGRERGRLTKHQQHQHQQQQQQHHQPPPQQPQQLPHPSHPQQQNMNQIPPSQFNNAQQPPLPFDASMPPPNMNLNMQPTQVDLANSVLNVPDWLIKEGGELRLSDTVNGESIIRYWPRYMNEEGHATLFHSLRKSVSWYQRRMLVGPPRGGGERSNEENWVNLPKLISWIGPCNYEKDGTVLPANTQWPPEVVDLLHRLIHFSKSQFNSCLMSLYNSGHSHHPWHSEAHTAMAKNPTTACISLGVTRTLEMKKAAGPEYLRFPLFPGSLFVMEGATHSDWLCQIPKEQHLQGERISLSFRTMLMIKGVTV